MDVYKTVTHLHVHICFDMLIWRGGGGGGDDIIEIENMTERKKIGFELDVCFCLN